MGSKRSVLLMFLTAVFDLVAAKNVHYIHWNRSNPMFRIDNTDHIVDVNGGNLPWEYDQANFICPVSKAGTRYPEQHVIYSVSREEYESCRITNPKPKIVAVCNQPHRLMYFTITFRSFTPTPGGLEFHPGHDYYFISTSSRSDLHRRVGGGCSTHNMRMIFKVHDNTGIDSVDSSNNEQESNAVEEATMTTSAPPVASVYRGRASMTASDGNSDSNGDYIYYYHPRDLVELENSISDRRRRRQQQQQHSNNGDDDSWREEALKYTHSDGHSSSSRTTTSIAHYCLLTLSLLLCLLR